MIVQKEALISFAIPPGFHLPCPRDMVWLSVDLLHLDSLLSLIEIGEQIIQ